MRIVHCFRKYITWREDPRTQHLQKLLKKCLLSLCEEGISHKLLPETKELIDVLLTGTKGCSIPKQLKLNLQ